MRRFGIIVFQVENIVRIKILKQKVVLMCLRNKEGKCGFSRINQRGGQQKIVEEVGRDSFQGYGEEFILQDFKQSWNWKQYDLIYFLFEFWW